MNSIIVQQCLYQGPQVIVCLVGLGLAFSRLRQNPGPATMVLIAAVMLGVSIIAVLVVNVMFWNGLVRGHGEILSTIMTVVRVLANLLEALATGVLIAAAFKDREPPLVDGGEIYQATLLK